MDSETGMVREGEGLERDGIFSSGGFVVFLLFARAAFLFSSLIFQPLFSDERALSELPSLLFRKGLFNICCTLALFSIRSLSKPERS